MLWLLLACAPPTIPEGDVTDRYTLRSWAGEPVGTLTLGQDGADRVEHARANVGEEQALRLDARLSPDGSWEAVVRLGDRWERHALSLDEGQPAWSRWRGLERLGAPLDRPPAALVEGYAEGALPGPESSLLAWSRLAAALQDGPVEALDPRTGRAVPLGVSVRETRTLRLDGAELQARRAFVWSGGQGHTLWVDESGRILSLTGMSGMIEARLDGLELPAPPPEPAPDGLLVEPLRVQRGDISLAGLRERPADRAPRGTVLLLHGSGPGDRDGNFGPVRANLYRSLARVLVEAGWEVLRYDKRGVGESAPPEGSRLRSATLDDLIADAAAWQALGGPCQVLIGHSEGAAIAAERASVDPRVAGVVFLAGPTHRLDAVLRTQLPLVLASRGALPEEVDRAAQAQAAALGALARGGSLPGADAVDLQSDWLRSHLAHNQEAVLAALPTPLLAIFGAEDLQVPPATEETHLREIRPKHTRIVLLQGLDHMLARPTAPLGMGAYFDPDRRLDPRVGTAVIDWLDELPCEAQ